MSTVEFLSVADGGLTALCEISLAVGRGQFVSIVGPNGAGKTTLFKAISGTVGSRIPAASVSTIWTCLRWPRPSARIAASHMYRKAAKSLAR